jgi:hypothetical protein
MAPHNPIISLQASFNVPLHPLKAFIPLKFQILHCSTITCLACSTSGSLPCSGRSIFQIPIACWKQAQRRSHHDRSGRGGINWVCFYERSLQLCIFVDAIHFDVGKVRRPQTLEEFPMLRLSTRLRTMFPHDTKSKPRCAISRR